MMLWFDQQLIINITLGQIASFFWAWRHVIGPNPTLRARGGGGGVDEIVQNFVPQKYIKKYIPACHHMCI